MIGRQNERSPACIGERQGHTSNEIGETGTILSVCNLGNGSISGSCVTYIDGIDVAFMESAHVPIGEQTVREKGEKYELW